MKILVYGAGAIGLYIGGSLGAAGQEVTFLARPSAAEAIRARGVRVRSRRGEKIAREVLAVTSLVEALAAGPHDCLVFALKSYATATAIEELRAVTGCPPPILCLQNGVGNEAELARAFGPEWVIAGTVTTAVSKPDEGEVVVERERGVGVALGHPLSARIVEALQSAGLNARSYPAPAPMKWSKLLINLIGNATSAILDMTVAELFADRRAFAIELAMLRECLAVMRALKYPIVDLPKTPVRALAFGLRLPPLVARPLLARAVALGRGRKMPSFHIDLHAGRGQTEVRWLNGAVARHGAEVGVRAPANRILMDTLEALSEGRANKEDFRRKPEALWQLINT